MAAGNKEGIGSLYPRSLLATYFLSTIHLHRAASLNGDDQRRTGTPAAAIAAGSDMLVLARAACDVPDPRAALEDILRQIHLSPSSRPKRVETNGKR